MMRSVAVGFFAMFVLLGLLWRHSGPAAAALAGAACIFALAVGIVLADRQVEP